MRGKEDIRLRAVLFDMDGTLIRSEYDWQSIRRELGVGGPSIIDALNALPEVERKKSWARLEAIERQASLRAPLVEGAVDLLSFLRDWNIKTALVTNNSKGNTALLMDRFSLSFDEVMTRDDGFYKPSGAPLIEAMRRLGVSGEETIAVGDSHYDIRAAREAGCSRIIIVNGGFDQCGQDADQAFESLSELADYFIRLVGGSKPPVSPLSEEVGPS